MKNNSKFPWGFIGGALALCAFPPVIRQCHPYTLDAITEKHDEYANKQYAKLMAIDPFGGNMVAAKATYWTAEPWTGDDTAYAEARQEVDTGGVAPGVLEAKYEAAAEAQPKSPLAQFRWGYALRRRVSDSPPSGEGGEDASAVLYSLTQTADPHTYNYARLRYLTSIKSKDLIKLGERLLRQDSQDNPVKVHLVQDYAFNIGVSGDRGSKIRAVTLCNQLLQVDPKNVNYVAVLGTVYEMSYNYKHNEPDAEAAIEADRRYISLVDPHSEYAQMKSGAIAEINADLAKDGKS